jgi:hypothetical protein
LAILHSKEEDLVLLTKATAPLEINVRECTSGEAYYGITILRSLDRKQVWNVFHGLPPKHPSVISQDLSVDGKPKSVVARGILCKLLRGWTTAYLTMPDSNTDKQLEAIFTAFNVPGSSASGRLVRSVGTASTGYPEMLKNESAARVVTQAYGQILLFSLRSGSFPNRLDQVGEFIDPWSGLPLEYRKTTNGFEVFSVGMIGKEKSYDRPAQRVRCLTEQFPYVAEL